MKVLFVLGGGLGNIIQAMPSVAILCKNNIDVELFIKCDTAKDLDIFKINGVKEVYLEHPKKIYDYQLRGPFTPIVDSRFGKIIGSRINYAQHKPEVYVYYDLLDQIGVNGSLEDIKISYKFDRSYQDYIGIYPGCKINWSMKRWDKYDLLCEKFEKVVIFGQEDDVFSHGNPAWIKRPFIWPKHVKFFQSSLQDTANVMSCLKFFVGNDGGLSHLAAATGVPTFVLFGPSSISKNKPFSSRCRAISLGLECSPCQFRTDICGNQIFGSNKCDCPFNINCMKNMEVDYVINSINKLL